MTATCKLMRKYLIMILVVLLLASLLSCDSSTSPKVGSLTGVVKLVNDTGDEANDPADHSGVTIALYRITELDTTVTRINQEYPHVGVQISQITEFDHRTQECLMAAVTDGAGSFSLSRIPEGLYNLVLIKENWGIRYINEVWVKEGDNNLDVIVIYPEVIVPSVVTTPITFMRDHVYRFPDDTIILSDVNIQSPCLLMIDPTKKIEVVGSLNLDGLDNFWRITSSHHMQSIGIAPEILEFEKVVFMQQENLMVENLIFERSVDGLVLDNSNTEIRHSILRKNSSAALIANSKIQKLSNINIVNNHVKGVQCYNSVSIEYSILAHNDDASQLVSASSSIRNCYFVANRRACRPFYGDMILEYNCFDANLVGVAVCASDPLIQRNIFYSNAKDIELNMYYASSVDYCNPSVTYNNFMGTSLYVSLWGQNSFYGTLAGWGANQDQHYPNNYFDASDLTNHIFDAGHPEAPQIPVGFNVNVSPRLYSRVLLAGIQ